MKLGLTAFRVVIGATMFAHGAQKLFGWFGGHGLATLQEATALVDDFRARLALNVSYDLACEALAFRLERMLG